MATLLDLSKTLYQTPLEAGVVETIFFNDQSFDRLAVEGVDDVSRSYNRELTTGDAEFIGLAATAIQKNSATVVKAISYLQTIAGDFDVAGIANRAFGSNPKTKAQQIAEKAKSISRKFRNALFNGRARRQFCKLADTDIWVPTGLSVIIEAAKLALTVIDIDGGTFTNPFSDTVITAPNAGGSGVFTYTLTGTLLAWAAPGDTAGAGVSIGAGVGRYTLISANDVSQVVVDITTFSTPTNAVTKTILVSPQNLEFDGAIALCSASQKISMGANGAAISFDKIDELIDMVKGGKPDMLVMAPRTIRAYRTLLRASGINMEKVMLKNFTGQEVLAYDAIPIFANEFLPNNMKEGTSIASCPIVAARIGGNGFVATHLNSAGGVRVEEIGPSLSQDSYTTRVLWDCGAELRNTGALAMLTGVTN
jgi:hypothetical protein